jgi:hypothetical protein
MCLVILRYHAHMRNYRPEGTFKVVQKQESNMKCIATADLKTSFAVTLLFMGARGSVVG